MSNPSIVVEHGPPFAFRENSENIKPATIEGPEGLDSNFVEPLGLESTFYRPSRLRGSSLERPDISAIRKEVLERPSTSTGPISPEAFPPRPVYSGSAKVPPRSR